MGYRGMIDVDGKAIIHLGADESKSYVDTCNTIKDYLKKLPKDKFQRFEDRPYETRIEINLSKKEAKEIIDVLLKFKKTVAKRIFFAKAYNDGAEIMRKLNLEYSYDEGAIIYRKSEIKYVNKTIVALRKAMKMKSKIPFGIHLG